MSGGFRPVVFGAVPPCHEIATERQKRHRQPIRVAICSLAANRGGAGLPIKCNCRGYKGDCTSVWVKSSPLNRSGAFRVLARA
jgi:hypothetical protein